MIIRVSNNLLAILFAIAATVIATNATDESLNTAIILDTNNDKLNQTSNQQKIAGSRRLRSRGDIERKYRSFNETCKAAVRVSMDDDSDYILDCETPNGEFYPLAMPASYVREKMEDGSLVPGETKIDLSNAKFDENTGELFSQGISLTNKNRGYRSTSKIGTHTMLMVRVIAKDCATSVSKEQMIALLSAGRDQLSNCSHNQFNLQEADEKDGIDTNIRNGVVEITLPNSASCKPFNGFPEHIANDVTKEINRQFGVSHPAKLANSVGMFMPEGLMPHNYGIVGVLMVTMKHDRQGTFLHEIGHNLGLGHSNEGGHVYEDYSGLMGSNIGQGKLQCYNGAKSWKLGWYTARHLEITKWNPTYKGLLGSVVSNPAVPGPPIIINMHDSYYLTFNSATGITADTGEAENKVVLTNSYKVYSWEESDLLAKMGPSGTYTIGKKTMIEIYVCSVQIQDATAQVVVQIIDDPLQQLDTNRFIIRRGKGKEDWIKNCKWLKKRGVRKKKNLCVNKRGTKKFQSPKKACPGICNEYTMIKCDEPSSGKNEDFIDEDEALGDKN